jgi:hypothetical protein
MAIPFADILQDGDFPVRCEGVYTHFNDIAFYAPSVYALKGLTVTLKLAMLQFLGACQLTCIIKAV